MTPESAKQVRDEFVRFCRGADLLIHDAQYLEKDMPRKHGWGHSLIAHACELALAAQATHLVLYHHDPDRSDDELDTIQEDARSWFRQQGSSIRWTAAEALDKANSYRAPEL